MAQFVQLQTLLDAFHCAGLGVVAITYDAVNVQQKCIDENGITYPFLSDIEAKTVKALGILNEEYSPGDGAYGIPHPGVFVIDADGTVVGKVFVEAYSKRVTAEAVLEYAKSVLN